MSCSWTTKISLNNQFSEKIYIFKSCFLCSPPNIVYYIVKYIQSIGFNNLHLATSTKIFPVYLSLEGQVTLVLCLWSCYAMQHSNREVKHRGFLNFCEPLSHKSWPNPSSAALRIQAPFRPWASASQGGGMCSDSESAGGSSESRSMDSPTASPGEAVRATHSFLRHSPQHLV